jgi:recombinational DNA repair ATPase RecF
MRILRLKLENWRGIESREIELDNGVTIIEGPNEIGKTTLIEALRLLFRAMDSTKSRDVKAIQPVGQDVGSHVEAEIETGGIQFIYSKQFNRNTETTLHIESPKTEQFTGREAHEKALSILDETVDLALWDALLVDQGTGVAQARLKDSEGLSKSLDEAAGTSASGYEESGLIKAVEDEFGKYFTPTGQARNRTADVRFRKASDSLDEAQQALSAIEKDVEDHEQSAKEVTRLVELTPELRANVEKHDADWQRVRSLKEDLEGKEGGSVAAKEILKAAKEAQQHRFDLIDEIALVEKKVQSLDEDIDPLASHVEKLENTHKVAEGQLQSARDKRKNIRAAIKLATSDKDYLVNKEDWKKEQKRLDELETIAKRKTEILKILSSNKINDEALEKVREAQSQLSIVSGRRDTAATNLSVKAESTIDFLLDNNEIQLEQEEFEEFALASETKIHFPGIAEISISPPKSAQELDDEFAEHTETYETLLNDLGVNDYSEAVTANQSRQSTERELESIGLQEAQLLQGSSVPEISQVVSDLQTKINSYKKDRLAKPEPPDSVKSAIENLDRLQDELLDADSQTDEAEQSQKEAKEELDGKNLELQLALQEKTGFAAAYKEKTRKLNTAREETADKTLAKRVKSQNGKVDSIESDLSRLKTELENAAPEATEAKYTNARQTLDRAINEHREAEKGLAVLADRLDQARANGRYESLETAEREYEESEREANKLDRRAEAANLLWKTLNHYRDETRKAYVQPLKDRIEKLGEIVFGSSFEIEVDDEWKLISRTLDGKTIPFDSLSVGAREQLGIIARLAAAQIVAKQGGVPLIIDDALGYSDPSRLESMGAVIARAGQDCQILLMTCSPGRFTHVGNAKLVKI